MWASSSNFKLTFQLKSHWALLYTMVMNVKIVRRMFFLKPLSCCSSFTCSALACACLSCATWGDWMLSKQNRTGHICTAFLQCASACAFSGVQLLCSNNHILCKRRTCAHTWYLSRMLRIYLCKFFLAGVNFYRFNAKNWQFTVYFAVITQKIGNFLCILS